MTEAPWPTELRFDVAAKELQVAFDTGEAVSVPFELLRVESPSAEVQGHSATQKRLVPGKRNVGVVDVEEVGTYAVRITFDDGHDSGIYTWERLLRLGRDKHALLSAYEAKLAAAGLGRD